MGFLRLLLRVPFYILSVIWEACLYFALLLLVLLRIILWAISPIVGDVNWSIPKWYPKAKDYYQSLRASLAKRKTLIGSTIIIVIIAYFSANYAYNWYLNRPQPIDPAPIATNTYFANYYEPRNSNATLDIHFAGNSRSPAPLALIGKTITEGIAITPNITGVWQWNSDKSISFKPTNPWPLGTEYSVKLDDKKLFAQHNKLQDRSTSFAFTTQDFSYSISNEELYQDPTNPNNKMGIFTINFSHPIDKASFENKISLALYEKNSDPHEKDKFLNQYGYTVSYNDKLTTAYIKSTQLNLPEQDSYLLLSIEKGISSSEGGKPSTTLKRSALAVPSKFNLNINAFDISLVEVSNQEMRQVLTVSFNYNVNATDLAKVVNVWQLPINKNKKYSERYYDELDRTYKTKFNVDRSDLAKSKRLDLKTIDTEQNYQKQISFELKADQNSELYIEVDPPLVSDGGYYLVGKYHDIQTVPMYPTVMNFAATGSLLSLSGDKKLPIVSRNMSQLKLEIARVIPSQLQHLVAFNQNDFQWMDFGDLGSDNFVEKYTVTKDINGPAESIKYSDIDLSQYLKKEVKGDEIRGVFLVRLYGSNHKEGKKDQFDYFTSRFIIVTDIGIINKKSLDQSQDIFVQSIRSGEPIKGAKVSVLGVNGIEITSQQTDDSGHVHFAPLSEYYQGIKPLFFVVEKDHDLSFLPISSYDRQLNFSRFDVGGIYETVDGGELRTHMFSDRGVYRPGDTFHIGMIVRAQDWSKSLAGVRLEADIYDPKSNKVKTQSIVLDEYGFNDLSYKTDYNSPTGEWYVNLYLKNPRDDYRTLLGSTSVIIREFEPDKTAVSLALQPQITEGWVHPDALSAVVTAKNLFGTPAQNRVVKSQLYLDPSAPYFKKYENYAFYQNITRYQNSFNIAIEDTITNENGTADLTLPIDSFEGNYTAKLLTEVFEPDSGRSVAATATVFVSPNDYLVGAKPDGRLDYIKKDSTRVINLIAVDANLAPISLTDLTLVKLEQRYLSVLVKQPSGVYKYESKRKDIILSQTPFAIDKVSTNYQISNEEPGNYLLQIKNRAGAIIYQTAYSIAGSANVTRNLDRNAELGLKIDDNQYRPGDEINVAITAPYVGSGIITIERDKVYAWKWFKTTTTSSVQKITVPEGIDGNAYINVQFIRDPSSDEIFMSPLSYAVIPFKISNDKFNAHIKLTAPEKIKPGETLPITIQTQSPQRVVIFAIDEGILQVSGYKLKNPLSDFMRKKALSVRTLQILDLILPEYSRLLSLSAPGGDADERLDTLSAHLNPFKRKVDEPVAYWSGIIDVDGTKTVDYKVPDYFNGKIRIMAVSVGKNTMGSTQTTTTVRNDFVLTPNIPYFVAPNDEFEISLSVANNLENIGDQVVPVSVTLTTTPQLTVLDEVTKIISLSPTKEGTLKFKLKATDNLGSGDLHFTAAYNDKVVTRQVSTSVRPASSYRLKTTMGRMDGSKQNVSGMRDMFAPFSQRSASASYSPFVLSKGLATYLADYPHFCSEQIVSRAMPLLIDSKYPEFDLVKGNSITLDSLFQTLQTRQNSEGAIGLWYSTYNVDPFITLYTVNFMLEAKEAGQAVPTKMLANANKYITQIASSSRTDEYGLRLRAYAIYLLTRQNQVTTSYLASIMADLNDSRSKWWQTDLTALYLASSYQMLKMDKEAGLLFKPVWKQLAKAYDNAWWNHNYYDPLVLDAGKIYLISKHFAGRAKDIPAQALENLVIMLGQERYTTQSSAMTMLALDSYSSSINTGVLTADDLTISSESSSESQSGQKDNKRQIIAKLQGLLAKGAYAANTRTVTFNNQTSFPAWYVVAEQGFDKTVQQQPITKGLEVYREFTDEQGKPVNKVTLGDKVNVTVRIRTLSKEGATNIAIVDLLPGGFEVVQQPINSGNQTNSDEYADEEDDYDEEYSDEGDSGYHWVSPIAVGNYTWYPDYTDVREDRVIIYGSTENDQTQTFMYQIKATNVGEYIVPSAYGEAMYDRDIQAVSKGGDKITVIAR